MSSEYKSNAVVQAIEDTLTAHLSEFITLPVAPQTLLTYHQQSGILLMNAAQAPAIWIDDKGSDQQDASGSGAGDTVLPGYSEDNYEIDLEIWLKFRKGEDARYELNKWRDAVQACLNGYWHLGDVARRYECFASKGDPAIEGPGVSSDVLWIATVRATVRAMVPAGSATL
jgi:hypothetical protein